VVAVVVAIFENHPILAEVQLTRRSKGHAGGNAGRDGSSIVGNEGRVNEGIGMEREGNLISITNPNAIVIDGRDGSSIVGSDGRVKDGIGMERKGSLMLMSKEKLGSVIEGREGSSMEGKEGRVNDGIGIESVGSVREKLQRLIGS